MKDNSALRKDGSNNENTQKAGSPKKESTQQKKNLEEDKRLHKRAAKRSNYQNDGPGGGYEGL